MAKRSKLAAVLDRSTQDPKLRAAGSVAAGGARAATKAARDRPGGRRDEAAYRLGPDETAHDGLTRVARSQLDLTVKLLKRAPRQRDSTETVHEARKALKRLRALLRVSRDELGREQYRRESGIFRDVGRQLSKTRDAQVLLQTLDDLKGGFAGGVSEATWGRLREALAAKIDESAGIDRGRSAEMLDALLGARARVTDWSLPQNGAPVSLADGFDRIYRKGRRAHGAVGSHPSTETRHELRKRAKDLWHAAQLLRPVCEPEMKKIQRTAHRLSDLLGEDHDLAILREHAEQHSELLEAGESELLAAVIAYRQQALRDEALTVASVLYREKPKKLLGRLSLA